MSGDDLYNLSPMGINKTEIDRSVGQSLFIGPADMSMITDNSLTSRWQRALTVKCALGGESRLVTSGMIPEALPRNINDGEQVLADIYSHSPDLVVDDARRAFELLDIVDRRKLRALPPRTDHIEFNRLYFLLTDRFRAMINAVVNEKPRGVKFNVFSEGECGVDRHERLLARLAVIFEDENVPREDRFKAEMAVGELRNLDPLRSGGVRRIVAILRTLKECGAKDLIDRYEKRGDAGV